MVMLTCFTNVSPVPGDRGKVSTHVRQSTFQFAKFYLFSFDVFFARAGCRRALTKKSTKSNQCFTFSSQNCCFLCCTTPLRTETKNIYRVQRHMLSNSKELMGERF